MSAPRQLRSIQDTSYMAHIVTRIPLTQTLLLWAELWVRVMTKHNVEIFAMQRAQIYNRSDAY